MKHPDKRQTHGSPAEHRLIARAQAGDRDAQQELWRAHRRWVAAIVLAHRPRTVEVDDLMQDVAVKLVSRFSSLRDAGAFRPWLRQIVINVCRGAARSGHPALRLSDAPDDREGGDRSPTIAPVASDRAVDQQLSDHDAAHRLLQQALTLPPEYREPLLLRCMQSMTYQQISELLDLPVTTIETRLARARRMLREEIGEAIGMEATRLEKD